MKKSPKSNDENLGKDGRKIPAPEKRYKSNEDCTDKKCPFHGKVLVKNEQHRGTVIKKDSNRTATIEWERQHYIPKYERYERRWSRLHVHNSPCMNAQVGDKVRVARTRPLSKTKYFAIIEVVKKTGGVS